MRFDKMLVFSIAMLGLAWGSIAPTLAEPQVELVLSRLPGRDSTAYQSLTETAGAHSVEILATSAAELWSIPQARVAAVTDKAVALGIGVSRVGPTWNRVLLPLSARAQMTDGQKSMMHTIMDQRAVMTMTEVELPGEEMLEYALTRRMSRASKFEVAQPSIVLHVSVGMTVTARRTRVDKLPDHYVWRGYTGYVGARYALVVAPNTLERKHYVQRACLFRA
jgi:hypothetical protein